eukprot:TRINITY_DN6110_c0_g1_i1.p1 TRINITY_DN6110_c0_g1~~TRINITY_DN6110_c0_g1_i1.p1  ORF type:complete len:237 (+),score=36.48 TRINITY_DN6110_c0_g1_i1:143-853(+)
MAAKTIAIIGVATLGREIATHFGKQGWTVICASRTEATIEEVAKQVDAVGGKGIPVRLDLTDPASLLKLAEFPIDLCVSSQSALWREAKPILECADGDLDSGFGTFTKGTWNLIRSVGAQMVQRGSGTLIQIGTTSALRTKEGYGPLAVSQFSLKALIQVAARELRPKNVHVAFLPIDGGIESEKTSKWAAQVGVSKLLPQGEIAKAVQYLFEQDPRAWTHELILRPAEGDWTAPQ